MEAKCGETSSIATPLALAAAFGNKDAFDSFASIFVRFS